MAGRGATEREAEGCVWTAEGAVREAEPLAGIGALLERGGPFCAGLERAVTFCGGCVREELVVG